MAKTVEVDLQVNTNLEPTIKNLRELKKQLRETAAGSKEFDKLSASIRDMEDSISDAKATNDDFLGQLENASGPLGTLGQGIRGAERTFSSFNGALKASVIGIIVGLVAGLAAAFSNNEKAQKKLQPVLQAFEKILGGVFAIVEPLFDTFIDLATKALPYVSDAFKVVYSSVTAVFQSIGKLGSAVGKLISGDFSGAWKDAKESVTGFSKNFDSAKNRYDKGSKEMTTLEKENAAKRAEALEKENERKKAAADKAAQEAEARRQKEKEAEEKALEEKKKRLQEEIDFQISLDNASRERRVAEALEKEAADAKFLEDTTAMVDALETTNTAKTKAETDARIELAKKEKEAKIQAAEAAAATLSGLADLLGKETAAGKAAAVASATISTFLSAQKAYESTVGIPIVGPVLAPINAALAIASGIKSVKSILSVKTPNGGGGAAPTINAPSGGSAPLAAAPSFNVVGTSGQNQIAQSLGNQAPVKAYVVSNDVTTAQSLDRNIVNTATIGN